LQLKISAKNTNFARTICENKNFGAKVSLQYQTFYNINFYSNMLFCAGLISKKRLFIPFIPYTCEHF